MNLIPPEARIDLDALRENAQAMLRRVRPRGLLAVVKWNAYGHGLLECTRELAEAGATAFGVSSPQDGVALRTAGITQPILVMTDWVGKPPKLFLDWNLEAAATSWYKVEYLEAVSRQLGRAIPAHIKFDTGLGRVGIHHREAERALRAMAKMKHLCVEGIYSHLAYSGPQDEEQGRRQIEIFERICKLAESLDLHPRWVHLANSAAAVAIPDIPGNLVRTGIALYGQPPSESVHELLPLTPVMTLVGRVKAVRFVKRGHGFPTPHFWKAPTDGWGAEVHLGHAISYPRTLAGKAHVLFRGKRRPLVGVLARDTCFVFTFDDQPDLGEDVVFWGQQGSQTLNLFELAPIIGALPYELPTWLSPKLTRVYVSKSRKYKDASTNRQMV
jgi:alanine racemase